MKNIIVKLLALVPLTIFASCLNKDVEMFSFDIIDESVQLNVGEARITGSFDCPKEVAEMKINIGMDEMLSDASEHLVHLEGQDFSVTIDGLTPCTKYYYCYSIDFGISKGYHTKIESFSTLGSVPVVKTKEVQTGEGGSCIVTCEALSEGGLSITERGICWNTKGNPTIIDQSVKHDQDGLGEYICQMNNLSTNMTYYVRAYAKNNKGVGYGDIIKFETEAVESLPRVQTSTVNGITATMAVCGGVVIDEGSTNVTSRGVCWSKSENPTVNDTHTSNGSGAGSFISDLTGLMAGATYYVKAYATNSIGTSYGNQISFTTLIEPEAPIGAIDALFSVSPTKQVWFSCGNLLFQPSTGIWTFAENQIKYVGKGNENMSETYTGWIDLFGWGTSNYNHGASKYQPWSTSWTDSDYYAYGSAVYHLYDQSGKADWGYNCIQNGGNKENYGWRTLTNAEWTYLLTSRQTLSGALFAKAVVNGVCGLLLLPDSWSTSIYQLNLVNSSTSAYSNNVISDADWSKLQAYGVVFLPAGGTRYGRQVDNIGSIGYYWSSCNKNASGTAYYLQFGENFANPNQGSGRCFGRLVRLVHDKK